MNINEFMKKLRRSQEELEKKQARLDKKEFEVNKQGVVIKALGSKEIISLKISQELAELGDMEQVEILIVAALKDLFEQIDSEAKAIEDELSQGMPF